MKKQIYTFVGLIIFLTVSSVTAIHAQSVTTARAHVPFDFSVKNRTVSAGDFLIDRQDDRGSVWSLRHRDNAEGVLLLATVGDTKTISSKGKLTFRRYGNEYFLATIETSACYVKLPKSRAERNLEKQLQNDNRLAKNNGNDAKPEIVAIEVAM